MKLPQETELERQQVTFYKLINFILSAGILASAVYGIFLIGQAVFG